MVPKEFRKSLCVIAGWVTLLEAVVWEVMSIYSVGVYGCSWDFFYVHEGVNTWSLLYVTYFMGHCQRSPDAPTLGFRLSPPTDPARHLHILMWIYVVISAAWIPACILLTVAASGEVRGRQGALLYYPWMALTAVLVVYDFAGAVFHFLHILHTTTQDNYARFTANTTWVDLTQGATTGDVTTWLPSLFVTLFFCRILVLWILNIFFLYGVYKGCDAVSLYTTRYLQSSLMPAENKKTWKDKFYQGPDPSMFEQQRQPTTTNEQNTRANDSGNTQPKSPVSERRRDRVGQEPAVQYRMDDFGIPIEELRPSDGREAALRQNEDVDPRSPFKPTVFDFTGRPVRSDSFKDHWRDSAPPIASGVQVPPELNKFEPFSYMAGDQPQRMRRPVSRSSSRGEQPPIPRPDYTIADRRAASLEYVPNRFRVPSPKRPLSQGSVNIDSQRGSRPLSSPKIAPVPPKKPILYPRSAPSIPEDPGVMSQSTKYIPQQLVPSHQQSYYTRQASAQSNNNYNINKLY